MEPICQIYRLSKKLGLYHIVFKSQYLMNMHFWRDSPIFPVMQDKSITLIDFMEEYTNKSKSNIFTYTSEYEGLCFDHEVYLTNYNNIPDENKYDLRVKSIHDKLSSEFPKYTAIITFKECPNDVYEHEFAHAMFYKKKEYRSEAKALLKSMDAGLLKKFRKIIKKAGYNYTSRINDEIQAYLATGFTFKEYVQEEYIPKAIIEEFELKFKGVFLKHKALVKIEKEFVCDL